MFDGGNDCRSAIGLSGEPFVPQVQPLYGKATPPFDGTAIAAVNVEKRDYQKEYIDYWNSTSKITGTGRPVDAIIAPLAPFPAARPMRFIYYGYTAIYNVIDSSVAVVPVTLADKTKDLPYESITPHNDLDKEIAADCMRISLTEPEFSADSD